MNQQVDPREVKWICNACAKKARASHQPYPHVSTFHEDLCGVCGRLTTVTEHKDFVWPRKR